MTIPTSLATNIETPIIGQQCATAALHNSTVLARSGELLGRARTKLCLFY